MKNNAKPEKRQYNPNEMIYTMGTKVLTGQTKIYLIVYI